jgi:pimeloyl-ACP methyl ester carboxylesterase
MVPGKLASLTKMMDSRRYSDSGFLSEHLGSLYGGTSRGLESYSLRLQAPQRLGYLYQLLAIAGWSSILMLPFIPARTLILMGSDDRVVPPLNGRILHALIQRSELEVIPGAGHLFLLTHMDQLASRIQQFLGEQNLSIAADCATDLQAC